MILLTNTDLYTLSAWANLLRLHSPKIHGVITYSPVAASNQLHRLPADQLFHQTYGLALPAWLTTPDLVYQLPLFRAVKV